MSETPARAPEPENRRADDTQSAAEIRAGHAARGTWMFLRGAAGVIFGLVTVFFPREQISGPAQLALRVDTADYLVIGLSLIHI